MKVYFLVTILISFGSCCLFGQSDSNPGQDRGAPINVTLYYSFSWELTTAEKSFFKRETGFDFANMVFDGIYKDYDKANRLIAEGFYVQGVKSGLQNEYAADRSLKSTIEYTSHDFVIWELSDENKTKEIKSGTGKFTIYYFYISGLISQPSWRQGVLNGEFQFGKRVGIWIYYDINKSKTDEEIYENGKLIKRIHFSETATIELDYKKEIIISPNSILMETLAFDHEAFTHLNEVFERGTPYPITFQRGITYPGGLKKLLFLLAQAIEIPAGSTFVAKLKVDEHGQVVKYKVYRSLGSASDDKILNKIKYYEKRFLPALKNGVPYSSSIYLPVSSGQDWIKLLEITPIDVLTRVD